MLAALNALPPGYWGPFLVKAAVVSVLWVALMLGLRNQPGVRKPSWWAFSAVTLTIILLTLGTALTMEASHYASLTAKP